MNRFFINNPFFRRFLFIFWSLIMPIRQIQSLIFLCALSAQSWTFARSLNWLLPVSIEDRGSWDQVRLTAIGPFGTPRRERTTIPAHLHTGVDIQRPGVNYENEPVFSAAAGRVISVRGDIPFSQIIIEHQSNEAETLWTVYEHVGGIRVSTGDRIGSGDRIARFLTGEELDRHGRQFDHLHFEIMRKRPRKLNPDPRTPQRYFTSWALVCYTQAQLHEHYYNPEMFYKEKWHRKINQSNIRMTSDE